MRKMKNFKNIPELELEDVTGLRDQLDEICGVQFGSQFEPKISEDEYAFLIMYLYNLDPKYIRAVKYMGSALTNQGLVKVDKQTLKTLLMATKKEEPIVPDDISALLKKMKVSHKKVYQKFDKHIINGNYYSIADTVYNIKKKWKKTPPSSLKIKNVDLDL